MAPAAHFPHALLESAERAFKATVAAGSRPSKLQQEVALRLWELGVVHDVQHLTPDGLFLVDIALRDCKVRSRSPRLHSVESCLRYACPTMLWHALHTATHTATRD